MTSLLLQRLDRFARNLIPLALSLLLVIVGSLPFQIPGYGMVAANLALMSVFYWSVYRPDLLPPWAAFLIGLLQDILVGTAPGLNALVLLLARAMVVSQGRVFRGKSFLVMWWGFAMVALGAQSLVWLLMAVLHLTLLDPLPAAFQGALTVALFPFLTWFLAHTQHAILQQG